MSAARPIVVLDRIWKSFGPLDVLTDVSLSAPRGEVVCIIGPSGAGKSTLLRCINYLETINDGTIHFEGKPVYRYKADGKVVIDPERRVEAIRTQIGMVFQSFNGGQRQRAGPVRDGVLHSIHPRCVAAAATVLHLLRAALCLHRAVTVRLRCSRAGDQLRSVYGGGGPIRHPALRAYFVSNRTSG